MHKQIERFFNLDHVRLLTKAAKTHNWNETISSIQNLRNNLFRSCRKSGRVSAFFRRIKRWLWPDVGLHVVFLGPDGVGKSTVIEAVRDELNDAFLRTDYFTFAPSLIPQKLQAEKKTRTHCRRGRIRPACSRRRGGRSVTRSATRPAFVRQRPAGRLS